MMVDWRARSLGVLVCGVSLAALPTAASAQIFDDPVLVVPTEVGPGDALGQALALDGATAVLGAPEDTTRGPSAGSAVVYVHAASGWEKQQALLPSEGADQFFGASVALAGDTLAVGAYGDSDADPGAGAVHVYTRTGSTWAESAVLRAPDARPVQYFGSALAFDGSVLAVGAPGDDAHGDATGAVYVYTRSGSGWSAPQKLVAADGAAFAHFGQAVAVSAGAVLVGAAGDVDSGAASGAAYLYTQGATGFVQQQKIVPASGSPNDGFGSAVALSATRALVGASGDDAAGADAGAAYVYARQAAGLTPTQKLTGSDPGGLFGYSVALGQQAAAVGAAAARQSSGAPRSGIVLTYALSGASALTSVSKLVPPSPVADQFFGYALALSDAGLWVGSPGLADNRGGIFAFAPAPLTSVPGLGVYGLLLATGLLALTLFLAARSRRRVVAGGLAALTLAQTGCGDAPELDEPVAAPAVLAEQELGLSEVTVKLPVVADTSVLASAPNTNFGADAALNLSRALLSVDSSVLSAQVGDGYVVSARLELPLIASLSRRTPRPANARRVLRAFGEGQATWNCAVDADLTNDAPDCAQPDFMVTGSDAVYGITAALAMVPGSLTGTTRFAVTNDVRLLLDGTLPFTGWVVAGLTPGERLEFASRESRTPPQLVLTVRHCAVSDCDDGNPCTVDSCDATASCAHTAAPQGTTCSDGDACTVQDSCQAGVCVPGAPLTCVALDACHVPGTCNPSTGACTQPAAPDGQACSDGNACTLADSCLSGVCTGASPVACAAADACHPSSCDPGTGACVAGASACALYGVGNIPASAHDGLVVTPAVLEDGLSHNLIGGFGSAIDYTGVGDLYLVQPDRGPNNGLDSYSDRFYQLRIALGGGSVQAQVVGAATLKSQGTPFTGLGSAYDATNSPSSQRLDPEALRVSPSGTFYTSDEYGPFVYEFDASGNRIRALAVPSKFLIDHPDPTSELPPLNSKGRQTNRGMEGLALSPDGSHLYGLMQNPLIQDGALNAANSRVGTNVRLLEIDVATGSTREYLYPLASRSYGTNEILAVSEHEFLVIERDGNAGTAAAFKRLFLVDISSATDISDIAALPSTGIPAGVQPVTKTPFLDLLSAEYGLAGASFPEKIEGLAFGPDLPDGRHTLIVTSDNDFLEANPNNLYVFALAPSALPGFEHGQKTFSSLCSGTSCAAGDLCHTDGSCDPGTGLCSAPVVPAGTHVGTQVPGDCLASQCDGAGHQVSAPDNADVADDGNQCTADACSAGSPTHAPVAAGTPCNQAGGTQCDGQGACVACLATSECPGVASACAAPACVNGACVVLNSPAGTLVSTQTTGDCQRLVCDGAGNVVSQTDDTDLPVDGNACTSDACVGGVPQNPPVSAGTSCGGTQQCDGAGNCVGCLSATSCPGVDGECGVRTCVAGSCGFAYVASGTATASQVTGDCQSRVCDGQGGVTGVANNADVPSDANQCTLDACSAGVPTFSNSPAGTSCSQNGGTSCDGNGACTGVTVAVVRVGAGSAALSNAATPVFVETYNESGTLLGTIPLPTSASGAQHKFSVSGTATSDGALSTSADGRYLVLAGYDATIGTAGVANSASLTVPRVVARISASGAIDTSTALTSSTGTNLTGNNTRAVASVDGSAFWLASGAAGTVYATLGASTGAALSTTLTNVRTLNVFGGQLYGSSGSGAFVNVFTVGSGTPSTAGQTTTALPGMPTSGASPYAFVMLDRSSSVPGVDTLYVADDNGTVGGIQKWTSNGSTWTKVATSTAVTGFAGASLFRGVTAAISGGNVVLFATSANETAGNRLVKFVDSVPFGGASSPLTGTTLVTAGPNTVFRGVSVSPR